MQERRRGIDSFNYSLQMLVVFPNIPLAFMMVQNLKNLTGAYPPREETRT